MTGCLEMLIINSSNLADVYPGVVVDGPESVTGVPWSTGDVACGFRPNNIATPGNGKIWGSLVREIFLFSGKSRVGEIWFHLARIVERSSSLVSLLFTFLAVRLCIVFFFLKGVLRSLNTSLPEWLLRKLPDETIVAFGGNMFHYWHTSHKVVDLYQKKNILFQSCTISDV